MPRTADPRTELKRLRATKTETEEKIKDAENRLLCRLGTIVCETKADEFSDTDLRALLTRCVQLGSAKSLSLLNPKPKPPDAGNG